MPPERVLVVEDDEDIRELLSMSLEIAGYEVSQATNGKEALALLEQGPQPSVILLDLMMPVMNGIEFLRVRKQDPRLLAIPVIVVSAYGNKIQEVQAAEIETQGFLVKPVDFEALLGLMRRHLSHRRDSDNVD